MVFLGQQIRVKSGRRESDKKNGCVFSSGMAGGEGQSADVDVDVVLYILLFPCVRFGSSFCFAFLQRWGAESLWYAMASLLLVPIAACAAGALVAELSSDLSFLFEKTTCL